MRLSHALRIQARDVIALVGGGGKTSLMFALAAELAAQGQPVVTGMTTRIFISQMSQAPAHLICEDEAALFARLPGLLAQHGHVLVAGDTAVEVDKVAGVPPDLIDRIARQPYVGAVIIEADGSRRLPLKAPAEHEPVIPAGATVVVPMVGIEVVGRPLGPATAHRPERVAGLVGGMLGDLITPAMVAAVLAHPAGGAQHAPPNARLIPFINKVETDDQMAAAREIARLALAHPRVDSVAIGAVHSGDPVQEVWSRVGAAVLAAGQASRFGALKQVLPWRGRPLVAHVAGQALACGDVDRVVVTVGARGAEVRAALAGLAVCPAEVADWEQGQSRSVQAGLAALEDENRVRGPLGAALFLLADQPGVSPALLAALVARHRETLAPIVAPRYQGRRGNPALFDRSTFASFAGLRGDMGARPILQARTDQIAWLDWPTPEITQDIDVASDYDPGQGHA